MRVRKRFSCGKTLAQWRASIAASLIAIISLTGGGCFLEKEIEPYYGRVLVPRAQEFRWSDGGLPRVFDPALAAAPPDTDAVRAMYEGLTEYDPRTLAPVPGVATRWESSPDGRRWTFHLRRNARWSNGEPVTAQDFVNSWQRTLQLGDRAPHARLLENIEGAMPPAAEPVPKTSAEQTAPLRRTNDVQREDKKEATAKPTPKPTPTPPPPFGVEAVNDHVLRVRLLRPDQNFPRLVAHPVFRPVHDAESTRENPLAAQGPVSNGAFQLAKISRDSVALERARNYWDVQMVNLQRVQFVAARDDESALNAYRAGEIDAVTNAKFEPLALKLLAPYQDFRRATYGALTYYSFNTAQVPFNDVRVREALAIAIDRDRISEDEMGGATEPAKRFLPPEIAGGERPGSEKSPTLEHDAARARELMAEAGYPQGQNFPRIRLLINRNDQQRQVARAVAAMWRSVLGVETEIIIKNWDEYEAAIQAGDYDVARRSVVMQTTDEMTNIRMMFEKEAPVEPATAESTEPKTEAAIQNSTGGPGGHGSIAPMAVETPAPIQILSETQALKELPAIPVYFASSYALVKPYVVGFDANVLDAPSLKHVRIDTSSQPPEP